MTATPDSTLADTRPSKADLQRELAELRLTLDERTHERDEALQRETATAEVLGVINSSPGDLAPVFDAMLEKAMRLCGADFGTFAIPDRGQFQTAATRGVPAAFAEYRKNNPPPYGPGTVVARILDTRSLVHIADMMAEELYRSGDPNRRALVDLGGARTSLVVPLLKNEDVLGVVQIYRQEVRPFTDKQIALLQNFAAQAVIAMENARLITETREALDQQTATAEVLGVINSSPSDLTPVFNAILEKAHGLCGITFGTLQLYDGEKLRAVATRGLPEPQEKVIREPYAPELNGPLQGLIHGGRFVQFPDLAERDTQVPNPRSRVAVDLGIRTLLFLPLRKDGFLLGLISAARSEAKVFSEREIALLENFAAQAVIAIENARLITETREALEQQTATAEVLQVINSSPGDLQPVFDAMLDKAIRLCEATRGHFFNYDGECFHLGAASDDARYVEFMRQVDAVRPLGNAPLGRISRGERIVHIADMREEEVYRIVPTFREQVELRGVRSQITVGLFKENTLLGAMVVYRQEVRPFTDKQIALLQNFAAQAVIAMENARLLGELRQRTEEVAELNRGLEARVADQLAELERTGKLRRFLAPQLADLIIAHGDESILESHRREIVVVFCDIRGFTAFAERAEPEEVMALLRDYHAALGPIVARFEGTLDHYSGDGVMVFFNDPLPTPQPAKRAIEMAIAMREAAQQVLKTWHRHGHDLGFGVGISQGYATLGQIGFAERMDYTAIGTVCNLTARLCDEAKDGQILISRRVAIAVEADAKLEEIGEVSLKGLSQAVAVYNVVQ